MVAQVGEVHRLAREYGDALFLKSGWSNPLGNIYADASDEDIEDAGKRIPAEDGLWLTVFDKSVIRVPHAARLITFAEERFSRPVKDVEEAITMLCEADGWRPDSYPEQLFVSEGREIVMYSE
ncbi:hypothetical protein GCM10022226_39980 [Sphaerisporangium flaviroseum]|uniref:Uncharacterized protein n=2 Tax=Sphaerisporangium flaviroseum TaxID=509199 RepID=A0ABP7ICU1_9ACTN